MYYSIFHHNTQIVSFSLMSTKHNKSIRQVIETADITFSLAIADQGISDISAVQQIEYHYKPLFN